MSGACAKPSGSVTTKVLLSNTTSGTKKVSAKLASSVTMLVGWTWNVAGARYGVCARAGNTTAASSKLVNKRSFIGISRGRRRPQSGGAHPMLIANDSQYDCGLPFTPPGMARRYLDACMDLGTL
ncbi:hypothetical protein GCM10027214_07580 [Stenotrophomonas tumulicola]